jgi:hypothetical protein
LVPNVSICLPVYNGERFLAEAVESALAQSYSDFELLIADDRSSDSSLAIAQELAKKDKRISVWSNPERLGLFPNYNACLQRASGTYIKLFAQDDLLDPSMLAKSIAAFESAPSVNMVCTARLTIDSEGKTEQSQAQFDATGTFAADDVIRDCLSKFANNIGEPSAVMFPSARRGSGFDTSFYHLGDLEYWFRIISGGNFVFLNEPLCKFRRHDESATSKNVRSLLFAVDIVRLGRVYKQHLAAIGMDEDTYTQRATLSCANFVRQLVSEEGLTCEESAGVDLSGMDQAVLLNQFRELAFHALLSASDSAARTETVRKDLEERVRQSEKRLSDIVNSRAWKVSRSLRRLVLGKKSS